MSDTPTFDLDFRPDYWDPADPIAALTRNVKGQRRREMIADIASGRAAGRAPDEVARAVLSEVHPDLLRDQLADPAMLGRMHPAWFGGEFLPDYLPGEVEIARIVLDSVTADVISIRARPAGGRIHYRVVDEYETAMRSWPESSERPLTFGELVQFIDRIETGEVEAAADAPPSPAPGATYIDRLRDECAEYDIEAGAGFVRVESPLYPQLAAFFEMRAREWVAQREADRW